MYNFLREFLPHCNKNNLIEIFYGVKRNNSIFDIKLNKSTIDKFIKSITFIDNITIITTYDKVYEFRYKNEVYVKDKNGISHYSYSIKNRHLDENIYIRNIELEVDVDIPQSIEDYDSVEVYDKMTMNINNSFDIIVKSYVDHSQEREYFTLNFDIKKPNNAYYIKNILDHIC